MRSAINRISNKYITLPAVCGMLLAAAQPTLAAPAVPKAPVKPIPAKTNGVSKTPPTVSPAAGPAFVDNTPLTEDQKIVHALNRLGFGPRPAGDDRPGDVERVKAMGLDKYIALQLAPEKIDDRAVDTKLAPLTVLAKSSEELAQAYYEGLRKVAKLMKQNEAQEKGQAMSAEEQTKQSEAMRQQARQGVASGVVQLQTAKMVRAVESERQLQEVLADFWSNHFNIDIRKNQCRVLKLVDERDVIRAHTFGTFRDLLGASAKSPAMLVYLDNAQSRVAQPINARREKQVQDTVNKRGDELAKIFVAMNAPAPGQKTRGGINENYAREIMELHTLGVDGGYTQKDVQEVARCLTGWGVSRRTGAFEFNRRSHDDGAKVVLGQRIAPGGGIKDGETVLDILAAHPSTAKYVSRKLCQRFVADNPPASLVNQCVQVWARTGGDLREVVRTIVTSDAFYSRVAYRQKIKSPFEFAVSSVRALGGTIDLSPRNGRLASLRLGNKGGRIAQTLIGQVATMGQPLFQHQAPTGYPEDGRKWVSAGALIARLNFALDLTSGKVPEVDLTPAVALAEPTQKPAVVVNELADRLLHGEMSPATRATLLKQVSDARAAPSGPDASATTKRIAALVLGSPEFQRR